MSCLLTTVAALAFAGMLVGCGASGDAADAAPGNADALTAPQGAPFTVHADTAGNQQTPAIAADAAGNFVVAWMGTDEGDRLASIFARRFDASGAPLGPAFRVNGFATNVQLRPSIAADAAGNFVVAWSSNAQEGPGITIHARRFAADGTPLGPDFRVDTSDRQTLPQSVVAMNATGEFVVAWSESVSLILGGARTSFIMARRYSAGGTPLGAPFNVTVNTHNKASFPAVAMAGDGSFVVAWSSDQAAGLVAGLIDFGPGIYFKRFDAGGSAVGLARRVDFPNDGVITDFPVVAMHPAGDGFAVAWQALHEEDRVPAGALARRYDAGGQPLGPRFALGDTARLQRTPAIALAGDGTLLAAASSGGGVHLLACADDCAGADAVRVDASPTPWNELAPAVLLQDDLRAVVAWQHWAGGDRDVQARLFVRDQP